MPAALTESNVRHLLRRAEIVDRPDRVQELLGLGSIDAAVDNVMNVPADPGSVSWTTSQNWERGVELTEYWLNRMAHDSPRPLQEKMSFFWHGLFCSEFGKVGLAALMREQIDLFRHDGLTNVRDLATTMSVQVAMLRYLDNNQNKASSPNQNFFRELMELFLLGVGNYNEADVEAGTAAWTGHTDQWDDEVSPYRWRPEWHDFGTKSLLGRTINNGGDPTLHGFETIEVILGNGIVPNDATNVANRGRPTREVAAEFLSRKLWTVFATDAPPSAAAMTAMRTALLDHDFDVRPWVRAMLTHDDFYAASVKTGLVRSPVEFVVALLHATGRRSQDAGLTWQMEGMGQRPLFPPNVSGWKANGYWINASAMERRANGVQSVAWATQRTYWDDGGEMRLADGNISREELTARNNGTPVMSSAQVIDRITDLCRLDISTALRSDLLAYLDSINVWERNNVLFLLLVAPEMQMA
ncbi:MAG: DUF1800 family protein [Ilumatobacteraceae bacterium]|nr:DUF1800 family protein [Ilumatobacteraceae bacterium]